MEVYGIHSGFRGLLDNDVEPLTERSLSGLLNLGGTILGTSREKPFKKRLSAASEDKPALMLKNIHYLGLDCIVCIGAVYKRQGLRFDVVEDGILEEHNIETKIGEIRITEIMGPKISLCKVNKGGETILTALNEGKTLKLISRQAKLFDE